MPNIENLDFSRLRAFQLAAQRGSLRAAAAQMHLTIPAISGKIRQLEAELGVELFQRSANKLRLTLLGERFLCEVNEIVERTELALMTLTRTAPDRRISVSVGSDHAWFFAPRIRNFLGLHPGVSLNFRVLKPAEAVEALIQKQIEVGFGIFPTLPRGLERCDVAKSTLSLAFNPQECRGIRPTSMEDLRGQHLILPPEASVARQLIEARFQARLASAPSLIEAPTCETASHFVEAGVGTAIMHSVCLQRLISRQVQAVDLGAAGGTVMFSAIYRKGATSVPLVNALIEEVS